MKTLVDYLIRYRLWLLLAVVVLLPVSYFEAKKLEFDQSIESLYAEGDDHLKNYLESKSLFGRPLPSQQRTPRIGLHFFARWRRTGGVDDRFQQSVGRAELLRLQPQAFVFLFKFFATVFLSADFATKSERGFLDGHSDDRDADDQQDSGSESKIHGVDSIEDQQKTHTA